MRAASRAAERRRARDAERRAYAAKQQAHAISMRVSPDRDLEGTVAQCAQDAEQSWERCRQEVRQCDDAARAPSYADRYERRDAAEDARRHAGRAEQHADAAETAAKGAAWAEQRMVSEDAEIAAMGSDWRTTYRAWSVRGQR